MQVKPTATATTITKPAQKPVLPGPRLAVSAFVQLMKILHAQKAQLTDEQVRFVQNAIQRFENETHGQVKTSHSLPKPKKDKKRATPHQRSEPGPHRSVTRGFIERLVKMPDEEHALAEIERLSDEKALRIALDQGLRAPSPEIARQKLAETVATLRDIERIAAAGKPASSDPTN